MCNHPQREAAMVILDPGTPERHGRDGVWCDPCLVDLIGALNAGGVRTVSSCCGHGTHRGMIALADGRWLAILPDEAAFEAYDNRINPDDRGEPLAAEVAAATRALDENYNPDRYPVMAQMFEDYARTALKAARAVRLT